MECRNIKICPFNQPQFLHTPYVNFLVMSTPILMFIDIYFSCIMALNNRHPPPLPPQKYWSTQPRDKAGFTESVSVFNTATSWDFHAQFWWYPSFILYDYLNLPLRNISAMSWLGIWHSTFKNNIKIIIACSLYIYVQLFSDLSTKESV